MPGIPVMKILENFENDLIWSCVFDIAGSFRPLNLLKMDFIASISPLKCLKHMGELFSGAAANGCPFGLITSHLWFSGQVKIIKFSIFPLKSLCDAWQWI